MIKDAVNKKPSSSPAPLIFPLWRLKYRPTTLEEIKFYHPNIYKQFKGYISQGNIPHIMFTGPKGSGKTVLAEILSRELLSSEFQLNYKLLFANDPIGKLERNESKKQGYVSKKRIGSSAGSQRRHRPFIQMRVKPFVAMQKFGDSAFKILAIKNFHDLDIEQQAFRRIMERYSDNCRMLLITDKISGIIDPIISRCQIIMVPFIASHFFTRFIKKVCDAEGIPIKLDVINYLKTMSKGNLGKALDLLQITFLQYNFVTLEYLSKMSQNLKNENAKQLFVQTTKGNFKAIRRTLREIFKQEKKNKSQILDDLSHVILQLPIERAIRAKYLELIADCDFHSLDSKEDEIQLSNLLAQMNAVGSVL